MKKEIFLTILGILVGLLTGFSVSNMQKDIKINYPKMKTQTKTTSEIKTIIKEFKEAIIETKTKKLKGKYLVISLIEKSFFYWTRKDPTIYNFGSSIILDDGVILSGGYRLIPVKEGKEQEAFKKYIIFWKGEGDK